MNVIVTKNVYSGEIAQAIRFKLIKYPKTGSKMGEHCIHRLVCKHDERLSDSQATVLLFFIRVHLFKNQLC